MYEINKSRRSVGTCSALLPPQLVLSDASLLLATPVDPLLLLLPQLRQFAAAGFLPLLDAIAPQKLDVEVRRNLRALAKHPGVLRRLHYVCDLRMLPCQTVAGEGTAIPSADSEVAKDSESGASSARPISIEEGKARAAAANGGSLFVRFNLDSTMSFLVRKHTKLAAAIAVQRSAACQRGPCTEKGGIPTPAIDSSAHQLAFSLFSAYLPKALAIALEKRLRKDGILTEEKPSAPAVAEKGTKGINSNSTTASQTASLKTNAVPEKKGTRLKRTAASAASTANKKIAARRRS